MVAVGVFAAVFLGFLFAAAIGDVRSLRIPNALTASMAGLGPVAVWLAIPAEGAVVDALIAGAATLAVTWAMFEMGWLGGGDAKLAAAAALWLGGPATIAFALVTALFGAMLAALLLVLSRWDAAQATIGTNWSLRLRSGRISVPYAAAMAPAGFWAITVRLHGLY